MAIPEMTMLASIFRKKLVATIVVVIFLTAVITGYLFNILFNNFHIYFTRSIFMNIIVVVAKGKVLLPEAYKIFFILTSSFLY
jgi:hypothetical protein